eukprot:1733012-Rhodomonas_salina.2
MSEVDRVQGTGSVRVNPASITQPLAYWSDASGQESPPSAPDSWRIAAAAEVRREREARWSTAAAAGVDASPLRLWLNLNCSSEPADHQPDSANLNSTRSQIHTCSTLEQQ